MSVLSRHRTIPTQRLGERVLDLDEPRRPAPHPAPPRGAQRTALLLAAGAVVVAAGVGTGIYLAVDDGSPAPSTSATSAELQSEARRDAGAAARNLAATTASESLRDASAALRFATR